MNQTDTKCNYRSKMKQKKLLTTVMKKENLQSAPDHKNWSIENWK